MFDHMLVPLDGSALAESVLPHAVAVARAFGSHVTLLRVLEEAEASSSTGSLDPLDWHIREAEANAYLHQLAGRLQALGLNTQAQLLAGPAADRIIEYTRDHDVDLIALSSHGRSGLSEWNVSSVVQKIIVQAFKSALLVRAYRPPSAEAGSLAYERLLVPLDGSQRAECGLAAATTLARFHDSRLLLAHVVRRPELPRRTPPTPDDVELAEKLTERNRVEAARYLDELRSWPAVPVETHLRVGDDVTGTLHRLVEQEHVDMVVLCAHGYSGEIQWPHGSVAISFIAYGRTPLLIVQDVAREAPRPTAAEAGVREQQPKEL